MNCSEVRSLLASRPVDALDEEEDGPLDQHLEGCASCRSEALAIEEAFSELGAPEPVEALPEAVWTKIVKAIEAPAEPAPAAAAPPVEVSIALSCAFCHDTLVRSEATYCASCLAPHHEDCWRQHGRCSAFGCEETHTVRARVDTTPPRRKTNRRRNGLIVLLCAGMGTLAGVAAWQAHLEKVRRSEADARLAAAARALEEDRKANEAAMKTLELSKQTLELTRKVDQEQIDTLTEQKNRSEDKLIGVAREFVMERRARLEADAARAKELAALRRQYDLAFSREMSKKAAEPPLVSIHVKEADLVDVIASIASQTKKSFTVEPDVKEKVTMDLSEVPWARAVALIARNTRCAVLEHGGDVYSLEQPPRVTIQFTDANVRTVLQLLAAYSGKNVVMDADVRGDVTMDFHEVFWIDALETIARLQGLYLGRRGEVISISSKPGDWGNPNLMGDGVRLWKLGDVLGETGELPPPIGTPSEAPPPPDNTIECTDCDARVWLRLMAQCSGRSIVFGKEVSGTVTLDLKGVTYENALEVVVHHLGDFVLVCDGDECLRVEARQKDVPDPPAIRARVGTPASHFSTKAETVLLPDAQSGRLDRSHRFADVSLTGIVREPGFARAIFAITGDESVSVKPGDTLDLGAESFTITEIAEGCAKLESKDGVKVLELKAPR